jgi:hypothetical protein
MEMQWYYTDQGKRAGPVSPTQLKELAASGRLRPSHLVWREGMIQWAAASQVRGLFPTATQTAPGLPPRVPVVPNSPGAKQPASATNSPSAPCSAEVQVTSNLKDTKCYYCTQPVLTESLNCPSCGKGRKNLNDVRSVWRRYTFLSISCAIAPLIFFFQGIRSGRWTQELFGHDLSAEKMFNDPGFWGILALLVLSFGLRIAARGVKQRYESISGKQMTGW